MNKQTVVELQGIGGMPERALKLCTHSHIPCPMHRFHLAVTKLGNIINTERNGHHMPPDVMH